MIRNYIEFRKRALLACSNLFFLPSGYSASNVLAAYRFKGTGTASAAVLDLSGHGYDLTANSTAIAGYSNTNGFSTGTLTSDALTNVSNTIKTAIIRYSGYSKLGNPSGGMIYLTRMKAPAMLLDVNLSFQQQGSWNDGDGTWDYYGNYKIGMLRSISTGSSSGGYYTDVSFLTTTQATPSSGVMAYVYASSTYSAANQKILLNGTELTVSSRNNRGWSNSSSGTHPGTNCNYSTSNKPLVLSDTYHNINILAAAFYTATLTSDQHAEVVTMMNKL